MSIACSGGAESVLKDPSPPSRNKRRTSTPSVLAHHAPRALEPLVVNIPSKYAQTLCIMFYTSFYSLLFPPGVLLTIAGLIVDYWVEKVR
jgi:hypothetical protein